MPNFPFDPEIPPLENYPIEIRVHKTTVQGWSLRHVSPNRDDSFMRTGTLS